MSLACCTLPPTRIRCGVTGFGAEGGGGGGGGAAVGTDPMMPPMTPPAVPPGTPPGPPSNWRGMILTTLGGAAAGGGGGGGGDRQIQPHPSNIGGRNECDSLEGI